MPPNPTAWLYTVSKNKTKDYFRHLSIVDIETKNKLQSNGHWMEEDYDFTEQIIADSQLVMIFAVCNSSNHY